MSPSLQALINSKQGGQKKNDKTIKSVSSKVHSCLNSSQIDIFSKV